MLLRMPSVGGGTTKRDRLSLPVGAVYRMVQGCYTPRDLMLSVVEMSMEFVISTHSNSLSLVRMALFRVSNATENETKARVKLLSETLMGIYWMLSGLWRCNPKPETYWGWWLGLEHRPEVKCISVGAIWISELLSRPVGLLGPICLFCAYPPGADEGGCAWPH